VATANGLGGHADCGTAGGVSQVQSVRQNRGHVTKETHGTFAQVRAAASPSLRPLCDFLRRLITNLDETCVEVVWPKQKIASFGVGPKKMTQHYAYIGIQKSHLNLGFYHGALLEDPAGLLEGTGKNLRHVKLHDVAEAKNPAIRALLIEAIINRRPYRNGA
jgi:hypothetical protein